jgi:hypothetical protein
MTVVASFRRKRESSNLNGNSSQKQWYEAEFTGSPPPRGRRCGPVKTFGVWYCLWRVTAPGRRLISGWRFTCQINLRPVVYVYNILNKR